MKMKYKGGLFLIVGGLFFALYIIFAYASFPDIQGHKYQAATEFIQELGIVTGYPDGYFRPENNINRAELLTIIVRQKYKNLLSQDCFSDVKAAEWYAKFVCEGRELGIVVGYPDGTFRPEQNVSFVEALIMLQRAHSIPIDTSGSYWFENSVKKASEMNGIPLDIDFFDEKITRGQMAEMMTRILKYEENTLDGYLGSKKDFRVTFEDIQNNKNNEYEWQTWVQRQSQVQLDTSKYCYLFDETKTAIFGGTDTQGYSRLFEADSIEACNKIRDKFYNLNSPPPSTPEPKTASPPSTPHKTINVDEVINQQIARAANKESFITQIGKDYSQGVKRIFGSNLNTQETITFKKGSVFTLASNLTVEVKSVNPGGTADEKIVSFKHSVNGIPTGYFPYAYVLNFATKNFEENFGYRIQPVTYNVTTQEITAVFTSLTPQLLSTADLAYACEDAKSIDDECYQYSMYVPRENEIKFRYNNFILIGPEANFTFLQQAAYELDVCLKTDLEYFGINPNLGDIPVRLLNTEKSLWTVGDAGLVIHNPSFSANQTNNTSECIDKTVAHELVHLITRPAPYMGILDEGLARYVESQVPQDGDGSVANNIYLIEENYALPENDELSFIYDGKDYKLRFNGGYPVLKFIFTSDNNVPLTNQMKIGFGAVFPIDAQHSFLIEAVNGSNGQAVINIYKGQINNIGIGAPVCQSTQIDEERYWKYKKRKIILDPDTFRHHPINYLPLFLTSQINFGGYTWQEFYPTASCFWSELEKTIGKNNFIAAMELLQTYKNPDLINNFSFIKTIERQFQIDLSSLKTKLGIDNKIEFINLWGNRDVRWK